ncbi:MAG TPA: hypothetical protein VEA40_12950 [Ramlibacter sp.]|nr:hypothetical protein [Ramlibacter sp.]
MKNWQEELARVEEAALQCEAREVQAHRRFDDVRANGGTAVPPTPATCAELGAWLSARVDTDEAWGRWATLMNQRPDGLS